MCFRMLLVCGASAMLFPGVTCGGAARLVLRTSSEVSGDAILLASLLPENAEQYVRTIANRISLGASPLAGSARILLRESVSNAISSAGLPVESFEIPESMSVSRRSEGISRERILVAIESSRAAKVWPQLAGLQSSDIEVGSMSAVSRSDVPLAVTEIIYDRPIHCFRFRIQPKTVPATIAFYATARVALLPETAQVQGQVKEKAVADSAEVDAGLPILVEPGQIARLHLHSRDFDTVVNCRPMKRGHLGELIRVRLAGSGKVVEAHVVAPGSLDEIL
jgi:hypothetical protein